MPPGIGIHHAGMLRSDRNLVERAFGQGLIKVRSLGGVSGGEQSARVGPLLATLLRAGELGSGTAACL